MYTKNKKEFKEKLYDILLKIDPDLKLEETFDWLRSRSSIGNCDEVYEAIKAYRGVDFMPQRATKLRCDYVLPNLKIIVEYDEIQHFTCQRLAALEAYPKDLILNYDKQAWIKNCNDLKRKMNKKNDPYRDEKRALYDSLRDILLPQHGYKLIRIYHSQIDFNSKDAEGIVIRMINNAK